MDAMSSALNSGDTAWVVVATALVMMMTPALGFFYGGMVHKRNVLSTLNLSFIFVLPVEDVIRIRTGERGHDALMYPDDIDERRAAQQAVTTNSEG